MIPLPEPTKSPCNECPWRRNSLPGHLGPHTAEEWVGLAHSEAPIACHKTIEVDGSWDTPGIRQCAGAGIFRTNVLKSPRSPEVWTADEPDPKTVFQWGSEFVAHHTGGTS